MDRPARRGKGKHRSLDRQARQRIRRKRAAGDRNQLGAADEAADAGAGEAECLGERLQHDQVRPKDRFGGEARDLRKFEIGFVEHDDRLGQCLGHAQDVGRIDGVPGGVVGRADEGELQRPLAAYRFQEGIGAKIEIIVQPGLDDPRTLQPGEMGVSGKGGGEDRNRILPGPAKGADQDIDRIVRAAGDGEILRLNAIDRGHCAFEAGGLRLGITIETGCQRAFGERRIGILVGIELDRIAPERLVRVGGDVERRERKDFRAGQPAGERGHASASASRISAARAWASRPSSRARTAAGPAIRAAASGVMLWTLMALRNV